MPKAEAGSTKWLSNNMKSKGLQRLRWYCQVCERQMRDENGFKQHTQSEGHVRAMLLVGEDPRKFINDYSNTFKTDFLRLLKTAHGEKKVHANHFYQEYIHDKEHIHMNSTKWPSLTEFIKYLGREGICRVEEGERGMEIAWVDDSPEALRRREDVRKKERMEKGDEEREARLLATQIKKAQEQKADKGEDRDDDAGKLKREEGQTVAFSLASKGKESAIPVAPPVAVTTPTGDAPTAEVAPKEAALAAEMAAEMLATAEGGKVVEKTAEAPKAAPMSFSLGGSSKAKSANVFSSKNNPLKQKTRYVVEATKKVSQLELIMKRDQEEQERRRLGRGHEHGGTKRQRLG